MHFARGPLEKMNRISYLVFSFLFLLIPSQIFAQIVINEFSSDNNPEWVELYNTSSGSISLKGCVLFMQDNPETNQKITFSEESSIDKFFLIKQGDYNWGANSYWLNNDSDKIILNCEGEEKDSIIYGNTENADVDAPDEEQSAGRNPDGEGTWSILAEMTPKEHNSSPPTPSPTNTPIPSNTPTPTKTPTPTSVPSATKTPTPKPTVKIVNTPTSTPKLLAKEQGITGQVLGQQENTNTSSSSKDTNGKTGQNLISGAKISLVLGLLFCGIAIMIFTQRFQETGKPNEKT